MKSSISSHYSDFQPSFNYKFFEIANAVHTSSKIPVTIWCFNIPEYIQNNQNYTADKIKNFVQKLWTSLNALKRISHPNLLKIYETSDEEAEPDIVSFSSERIKFCLDGSCFKKSADAKIQFSKDESLFIASQISDGLAYLHDQLNVANFGICPENIFITPNFEVKIGSLIHFAKFSEPLSVIEPSLYPAKSSIFDIDKRFLAPELKAHNNVTSKADVYMYGLTILYCYEGESFLNEMSTSEIPGSKFILDFLNSENASNTPEDMKLILSKCLSVDPSERPTFQQIADSSTLTQLQIKALNFLDTIDEKPVENHKSFYRGLAGIIDQFSERLLLLKVIPILVNDIYTNYKDISLLLDHILPMLVKASNKLPAYKIDTKIVKKLFPNSTCHNFFMDDCRTFLTSENENNEIKDKYSFVCVVILNAYRLEDTKEKGKYLMKLLFEQITSLDQDDFKEHVLNPLFSYPDCAILFLYYIQTTEEEEDEDKDFQNLAIMSISHALEVSPKENSSRLNQKVLELIPTFVKYGKNLKLKTFNSIVLEPIIDRPELLNVFLDNLNQFDDPDYLAQIAFSLKEHELSYARVFPILMPKCETMKLEDFEEKVFKPFFFSDRRCALSMIENIDKIQKIESSAPHSTEGSKLTVVQSIIVNSYRHKEELIREKVPDAVPILLSSIVSSQKKNPTFLRESIFEPFYENFSPKSPPYQEKCILQLVKNSPTKAPIADIIVDLTFEHCKSNEEILEEVSKHIPTYLRNTSQIKPEAIQYLIDHDKYTSTISDVVVSKISTIDDPNIKLYVLKYALENATETTDFATLAWIFITAANSTEFCQKYNSSKFSEIQTMFVGPLFKRIESADYLIQNFDSFDHQFPTSKKIQMLLVTEISALANDNPDLSALNDMVPQLIQKCAIDTAESISSIRSIAQSISYNEPIDSTYISTVLDSLNKQTSEELAPECSKQLRALFRKIKKVKNDDANKVLIINKIATVLSSLPPYSHKTRIGVTLAIELVENKSVESSKREKLLNFIDQTINAIRSVQDYQPSEDESEDSESDDNTNTKNDDSSNGNDQKQNQENPGSGKNFDPFESPNGSQNNQDPFSSTEKMTPFADPFANTTAPAETNQPIKDPFNAASSSNDPFKLPNKDPFSTTSNSSFNAASSNNDFFNQGKENSNPFSQASNANNNNDDDDYNNKNPFNADSNRNNPFSQASDANNNNDPFSQDSTNNNNDPFKTPSNNGVNFSLAATGDDPFKTAENNSNPFKSAPANNDPFNTGSSSNDPFKSNSQSPVANQEDNFSSQSSSTPTPGQSSNNLSQFPSLQQSTTPQNNATKSVKIDTKKDKKKEKEKEKEKKKKEKLEKKLKAKEKKTKDKDRRKSRNDLQLETPQQSKPTFLQSPIKAQNDPNQALKMRAMSKPSLNPFNTPSNTVDPFKQIENNQNHFGSQATTTQQPNQNNDPFGNSATTTTNNNPFASSSTNNNNNNNNNRSNPFASAQTSNAITNNSNLNNPFFTAQQPANNNNPSSSNDPFAKPPQNDDNDQDDEDDDDDESDHQHHHHHHHHGKSKSKQNDSDDADNNPVPERRQGSRRNTGARQSIQPTFNGRQDDNVFKQSHQRTPSFDIFGNAKAVKTSSFGSESKGTSDAKIDFNNDELDFDD